MRERQRAVRSDLVVIDVEGPWLDLLAVVGIVGVRDELLAAGRPVSQAAGMAVWLHDQASRQRLVSGETARSYRSLLRQLGPPSKIRAIQFNRNTRAA